MKIKIEKYPAYKDSGVEWLGEIPKHWDLLPGLSFIFENKNKNTGMQRDVVLSLSYGNIRVKGGDELTGLVPESFETYQFVNVGDLIFRPTDLQNDTVSLRSSISEYEGIITNAYLNLRFTSKANSKYFHYFFRAIDNNKIIYGLGSGLRQNISYLDFRRFNFPFPPLSEQTAIAAFLDRKTALIDQAIDIKQKQIELLKERRQILIHNAVTRGLDPNVKMKDSGVEWIGEVPEHWEVKRLKHCIAKKIDNRGRTPEFGSIGIPMLEVNNITNGNISPNLDFNKFVLPDILVKYVRDKVRIGDLLISTVGATSGKVVIINDTPTYFICQNVVGLRMNNILIPKFAYYAIGSTYFNTSLMLINKGNTIDNLKVSIFVNNLIFTPPIIEQQKIIEFIDFAEFKIATAISLKQQEIEKLKEYKATLINSVVTGKVKVG